MRSLGRDIDCFRFYDLADTYSSIRKAIPRGLYDIRTGEYVEFTPRSEFVQRELLSPNGQKVAYFSGDDSEAIGQKTLKVRQVTSTDGVTIEPGQIISSENPNQWTQVTWSPDSNWIGYHAFGGIALASADGRRKSQNHVFIENQVSAGGPIWSADSKYIVMFHNQMGVGKLSLWSVPNLILLNPCINNTEYLDNCDIPYETTGNPEWSPQGHLLAYVGLGRPDDKHLQAIILEPENSRKVSTLDLQWTDLDSLPYAQLFWSSDSRHLGVVSWEKTDHFGRLDILNIDGSPAKKVTSRLAMQSDQYYGLTRPTVAWSANGKKLFFTESKVDGNSEVDLKALNFDSDASEILVRNVSGYTSFDDYNPDRSYAVIGQQDQGNILIDLLNTNGGWSSRIQQFWNNDPAIKAGFQTFWSPSGKRVAVVTAQDVLLTGIETSTVLTVPISKGSDRTYYKWSTDEHWLIIYNWSPGGLWTINTTTGSLYQLSVAPVSGIYLSPDNDEIAFLQQGNFGINSTSLTLTSIDAAKPFQLIADVDYYSRPSEIAWSERGNVFAVVTRSSTNTSLDLYDSVRSVQRHFDHFVGNSSGKTTDCH